VLFSETGGQKQLEKRFSLRQTYITFNYAENKCPI